MHSLTLKQCFDSIQGWLYWRFRFVQRLFFHLFGVFFVAPHERTIGNTTEEIHFALITAKQLGKKVIFLRRFTWFGAPKIPNFRVFEIEGDLVARGPIWGAVKFVAQLLISVIGHGFAILYYLLINSSKLPISVFRRKVLKKDVPIFYVHFRRCFYHQQIGIELSWRGGFPRKRTEVFGISGILHNREGHFDEAVDVKFTPSEIDTCENRLLEMGITKGDWFVCLHNREPGYHADRLDLRNSSISNYFSAIKLITEKGGWVVRMGDSSMTPLPKMNKVIDYPFTCHKSELMDLFLVKRCRFFFGQNSGIVDLAYLFHKQCVLVNTTEWAIGFPRLENSRVIFKHFFSKKLQRYLSVRELLEQPFSVTDLHQFAGNIEVKENSESEIASVITEALGEGPKIESIQEEFLRKRKIQMMNWLQNPLHHDAELDRIFRYRLFTRALGCRGTAGLEYLNQNWEVNSLNLPGEKLSPSEERIR